ncbi:LptF/LptG family permease [Pedobacter sp. HMF7647]|uniref:LptF/LptG family permease n=1 Tax=Hufsiella arboris TaxID=2695275 RepID=A0A7K1YE87_9SPHI|nr:LptF/LptG family permease [Hufsiella arboris]
MKKIYLLVLKAFIRPFIVTFFIVMFVLLMLFLFKYIDDLIGKGFEWYVILQLLWYASATNVAMALPLAMLLSSIMTFGTLGENYELVAIKSSGVSLQKAMTPLFILIGLMSIGAFLFSDYMLPVANLKMGSLLYDVRNQKAAFLIEEGIFNNSISGYTIRVNKKDKDGQTLHGVLIYQENPSNGNVNTVMAKEGKMFRTDNNQFLVLKLKDGVRYEESPAQGGGSYNPRQIFRRLRFNETEQKFDMSGFKMQHTDEGLFKNNYSMLNLSQLSYYRDSTTKQRDSASRSFFPNVKSSYKIFTYNPVKNKKPVKAKPYSNVMNIIPKDQRMTAITNAKGSLEMLNSSLSMKMDNYTGYLEQIRRYMIEFQRKFTLSFSCLVLFSIGAPLGAIIRKGGLGMPVVVSIIFFLIYHIIATISEKTARDGAINPILGMWMAIIVLTPVAIFLTYKATVDSALFDMEAYKLFFQKLFKKKERA